MSYFVEICNLRLWVDTTVDRDTTKTCDAHHMGTKIDGLMNTSSVETALY